MAERKTHRGIPDFIYRPRMAALSYWLVYRCGMTQQQAARKLGFASHSTINRHLTHYFSH